MRNLPRRLAASSRLGLGRRRSQLDLPRSTPARLGRPQGVAQAAVGPGVIKTSRHARTRGCPGDHEVQVLERLVAEGTHVLGEQEGLQLPDTPEAEHLKDLCVQQPSCRECSLGRSQVDNGCHCCALAVTRVFRREGGTKRS